MTLYQKSIDALGGTRWVFKDDADEKRMKGECCCLRSLPGRGDGVASLRSLERGQVMFSERSVACLPVGKHRQRVCSSCFSVSRKKVRVASDCPEIFFCSEECLHAMDDFTTVCGGAIAQVYDIKQIEENGKGKGTKDRSFDVDLSVFVIYLLYYRYSLKTFEKELFWGRLLKLEVHKSEHLPHILFSAKALFECLKNSGRMLLRQSDSLSDIDRLLRIVYFNAQSFAVPELPGTNLMCIFLTASKLNHSCVPNATLSITSIDPKRDEKDSVAPTISASVILLSEVSEGEEITMSYLSRLCTGLDERQNILRQSFLFSCSCVKCKSEQRSMLQDKVPLDVDMLSFQEYYLIQEQLKDKRNVTSVLERIGGRISHLSIEIDKLQKKRMSGLQVSNHVYPLHSACLVLFETLMTCKQLISNSKDCDRCDGHLVRLVYLCSQCWSICNIAMQQNELQFVLVAATAALRLCSSKPDSADDKEGHAAVASALELIDKGCQAVKAIMGSGEYWLDTLVKLQNCHKVLSTKIS